MKHGVSGQLFVAVVVLAALILLQLSAFATPRPVMIVQPPAVVAAITSLTTWPRRQDTPSQEKIGATNVATPSQFAVKSEFVSADSLLSRLQGISWRQFELQPSDSAHRKSSCVNKGGARLEYTHRKPRKGELSTLALRERLRASSSYVWEDNVVLDAVSRSRVVGSPPVCFTPNANLSVPFGSWKTRYYPSLSILSGLVEARPPQVLEVEPIPYVSSFMPGITARGSSVACDGTTVTAGGCLWEVRLPTPLDWLSASPSRQVAVSVCDEWCKGYYHFTHEHLPRVAPVYHILRSGNATLALSHRMNGFQRQFFVDILQIPKITEGEVYAADQVLHPTPMRCGNTFTMILHQFRDIVFRQLQFGQRRPGPPRLLFAERGKGSRMASNYGEIKRAVEAAAARYGVSCQTTRGTEHAREQLRLFYDADIVIGPHGANLANSMFMRRGGHVIEMASMAKGNMCYYTTTVRVGLVFHFIPHMKGKDDPYTLDPDIVVRHVEHAINATMQNSL